MTDRYLKQLGNNWTKNNDGQYVTERPAGENAGVAYGLLITRHAEGWTIHYTENGHAVYGHFYPSFRQLFIALNDK